MEQIYLPEKDNRNAAVWYLDNEGDLFGNKEEAGVCGIDKEITTNGFYTGSVEDWKTWILEQIKEKTKKLVTFTVNNNGSEKTTKVNLDSIKKAMKFDPDFDRNLDVYNNAGIRAVEKMYGKGKYFIQDNSGIDGRGQIWEHSPNGGSDSVTGIVNIESDFFE